MDEQIAYFRFDGHPKTRQNLRSEGEIISFMAYGVWQRGQVRPVFERDAPYLRMLTGTHGGRVFEVFVEVTGPEDDAPRKHPAPEPKSRSRRSAVSAAASTSTSPPPGE